MNIRERKICQQIYEENAEHLRWYLWKKFGWLNQEDLYDVMQDVWRILSENIEQVGTWIPAAQWKWLETVAHNRVVNMVRKSEKGTVVEETITEEYKRSTHTSSAEDVAVEKVTAEKVLNELSEKDKKTIFQSYLQSDTAKQSKRKNNADTCKNYRAKKKLLQKMKEGGMDD